MANWYAVYTRVRWERRVAEGFLKRGWPSYCPVLAGERDWLGRRSPETPLFPGYVFVRAGERDLAQVRSTEGVRSVVYWLGSPAVIREVEIEMLRRFVGVHGRGVSVERARVDTSVMVRLSEAPSVVHKEGGVVSVEAAAARLLLPSLGYVLTATHHHAAHSLNQHQVRQLQNPFVEIGQANSISK